jgi:cyclohexanone monooxygenase
VSVDTRIAKQAKHLYVQRTANFSLPARNAPMDPPKERSHKALPGAPPPAFDAVFGIAGFRRGQPRSIQRGGGYTPGEIGGGSIPTTII